MRTFYLRVRKRESQISESEQAERQICNLLLHFVAVAWLFGRFTNLVRL